MEWSTNSFMTVTLGERCVVVFVKMSTVWRFMDVGYGCKTLKTNGVQ